MHLRPKCDLTLNSPHHLIPWLVKTTGCKKVLDVGCGFGEIASKMVESGIEVIGCELDSDRASVASNKAVKVIVGDIQSDEIWEELARLGPFDGIVLADVLEHLVSPDYVLAKVRTVLRSDGAFLMSLPNVAHYSVRLQLLRGKFEYTSCGVLDMTHLRFFTLDSACRMARKFNLEIESLWICCVFPRIVRRLPGVLLCNLGKSFPNFFGQQIVFLAHLR